MMLISGIITGILLTIIFIYFLAGQKSPNGKVEIPVTHTLAWWPLQEKLEISMFSVRVDDENLNLLKTNTNAFYTIEGTLKHSDDWRSYIKQVHISEKLITRNLYEGAEIEIIITPIVGQKKKKGSISEITPFAFTNSFRINSVAWGKHKIRFICGTIEETIALVQRK